MPLSFKLSLLMREAMDYTLHMAVTALLKERQCRVGGEAVNTDISPIKTKQLRRVTHHLQLKKTWIIIQKSRRSWHVSGMFVFVSWCFSLQSNLSQNYKPQKRTDVTDAMLTCLLILYGVSSRTEKIICWRDHGLFHILYPRQVDTTVKRSSNQLFASTWSLKCCD